MSSARLGIVVGAGLIALAGSSAALAFNMGLSTSHRKALEKTAGQKQRMEYIVSIVDRVEADKVYAHMLTDAGQVIVTAKPQANAKKALSVAIQMNERLYLVDTVGNPGPLKNEIGRLNDAVRLVAFVPKNMIQERLYHDSDRHQDGYLPVSLAEYTFNYFRGMTEAELAEEQDRLKQLSLRPPAPSTAHVDQADFEASLRWLVGLASSRPSARIKSSAKQALVDKLTEYGFEAKNVGNDAVYAFRKGTTDKWYAVGAHFDTFGNIQGADDDAGGCAIVMEVAKKFGKQQTKNGLGIYLFDREEQWMKGSQAIVKTIKHKPAGMVNVEMPLYDGDRSPDINVIECSGQPGKELAAMYSENARKQGLTPKKKCTDRSDQSSFWKIGVPAFVMSENFFFGDGNPQYHKRGDTINASGVDMGYFAKIGNAVVQTVDQLLNEK